MPRLVCIKQDTPFSSSRQWLAVLQPSFAQQVLAAVSRSIDLKVDLVKDLLPSTQHASYWHFPFWPSQHADPGSWHHLLKHLLFCFVSWSRTLSNEGARIWRGLRETRAFMQALDSVTRAIAGGGSTQATDGP